MPIYEYQCPDCGERYSRLRPIREMDAPAACPKCGGETARRVLSVVADTGRCTPAG